MILTKVKNEIGATAIEYGLIASLVAVVAVSGMSAVGMNLSNTYCTISKHLGGSGTCSGASTGNANGGGGGSTEGINPTSGNGGGATRSVNNENSQADLTQIQDGLTDFLNPDSVPYTLGGNDYPSSNYKYNDLAPSWQKAISNWLNYMSTKDPITNVYGVYDNNTPITDYSHLIDAINEGGDNVYLGNHSLYSNDFMEITTKSGKVYTISKYGTETENGPPLNP